MKKMLQDQRRDADVRAVVSSGSKSCTLRTDYLTPRVTEDELQRRVRHLAAEGMTPRLTGKGTVSF